MNRELLRRIPYFWKFQLFGWAAFVAVTFPRKLEVANGVVGALFLCMLRDGSSFLITVGLRYLYRALWSTNVAKMAALILLACAVCSLLQNGFLHLFGSVVSSESEFRFTNSTAFDVFYERAGLLFGWSAAYFGIRYAIENQRQALRLVLIEREKKDAKLHLLRTQMNPHFLFNALNHVHLEAVKVRTDLGQMVQSLADYLRYSLDHTEETFVPLEEEFKAMRDYLRVEELRLGDWLDTECVIADDCWKIPVPGIVLQPLVENALKYGMDTSEMPLRIRLKLARADASTLRILVSNTGRWLEPEARQKNSHLGLENLRQRLDLIYPHNHLLDIAEADSWVTVTINIPIP